MDIRCTRWRLVKFEFSGRGQVWCKSGAPCAHCAHCGQCPPAKEEGQVNKRKKVRRSMAKHGNALYARRSNARARTGCVPVRMGAYRVRMGAL